MTLGENITRLRLAHRHTNAAAFARLIGVSAGTLGDWEKGRYTDLSMSNLLRLAKGLPCAVDELLVGVDPAYDQILATRYKCAVAELPMCLVDPIPDADEAAQLLRGRRVRDGETHLAAARAAIDRALQAFSGPLGDLAAIAERLSQREVAVDSESGRDEEVPPDVQPPRGRGHRRNPRAPRTPPKPEE